MATVGIDYYQLGYTTGEMALRILKGEKPQEMAVQGQVGTDIILNLKAAERIGLTIPKDVLAKANKTIK